MIFTQCTLYFANASENWQGSIGGGGEGCGESSLLQNLTVVSNRDVP